MANAKKLIKENLKTKNPYLDLGNCGLDGTEDYLSILAESTHLETLIFSNQWHEYDLEKQEWITYKSQNKDKKNKLIQIPNHLAKSLNLKVI